MNEHGINLAAAMLGASFACSVAAIITAIMALIEMYKLRIMIVPLVDRYNDIRRVESITDWVEKSCKGDEEKEEEKSP